MSDIVSQPTKADKLMALVDAKQPKYWLSQHGVPFITVDDSQYAIASPQCKAFLRAIYIGEHGETLSDRPVTDVVSTLAGLAEASANVKQVPEPAEEPAKDYTPTACKFVDWLGQRGAYPVCHGGTFLRVPDSRWARGGFRSRLGDRLEKFPSASLID